MNIKILSLENEIQMLDLLRSERLQTDTEMYLDRDGSFFGIYNWFSKNKNFGIGIFQNDQLIGMASVIPLPFKIKGSGLSPYLLSDCFIHPHFRSSFAAARLFAALQDPPVKNIVEIGIENRPGFAQAIGKFSRKHGHSSIWTRESVLNSIYPNQVISKKSGDYQFYVSQNWSEINSHLKEFVTRSNTWIQWISPIEIQDVFRQVWYFRFNQKDLEIEGLLVDRGNLERVRWNGQPRMYIEKHRRRLKHQKKDFVADDELTFCNVCFFLSSQPKVSWPESLIWELSELAFKHEYFCLNLRDIAMEIPKGIDSARFPRLVNLTSDCPSDELVEIYKQIQGGGVLIEPVYL